jgi:hypothetical protein
MRTVKTTSGATAVQVVWSSRRGSREIEHLGSAHDEAELEALKTAAQQRIAAGQLEFGLGLEPARGRPLPITSSKMSHLVESLDRAYRVLGFEDAADGDEVFRQMVLARIIEPVSKLDSLRVLGEAGVTPASYRTLKRRLSAYAEQQWRQRLSEACAAHARLGPASLVLYDVSTLHFETGRGTGSASRVSPRNGGWSHGQHGAKSRRRRRRRGRAWRRASRWRMSSASRRSRRG